MHRHRELERLERWLHLGKHRKPTKITLAAKPNPVKHSQKVTCSGTVKAI